MSGLNVGDKGVISITRREDKNSPYIVKWNGFEVEILENPGNGLGIDYYCRPLSERPDDGGRSNFYWPKADIHAVKGVKDWRGNNILPGSTVVYPVRGGSGLWVNEAEVLEILPYERQQYVYDPDNGHRYETVEKFNLRVRAKGTKFEYDAESRTGEHVPYTYIRTLTATERVTVV